MPDALCRERWMLLPGLRWSEVPVLKCFRIGRVSAAALGPLLSALLIVSLATSASAQSAHERAREMFERAVEFFEAGNYARALTQFRASYDALEGHPRRPLILYNIARCLEEIGHLERATATYEEYLALSPDSAPYRADAQARIEELRTRQALARSDSAAPVVNGASDPPPPTRFPL